MDFTGQVAVSTGAASGMGLLFAENFSALATKSQPLLRDMKLLRDTLAM